MILIKKLTFAPFFLVVFGLLIYQLAPLLGSYDFIFSLSETTLIQLTTTAALITLSGFLFVLFAAIAQDWKLIVPIIIISSLSPLVLVPTALAKSDLALAIVFTVAIFAGLCLIYVSLETSLKKYLDFQPSNLLGPSIRHLSTLLILSFSLVYFLSVSKTIAQNSFQIPDALIDTALKMSPVKVPTEQDSSPTNLPAISSEQLQLLKQNPDLLKQYGLDPKMLDDLSNPQKTTQAPEITNNLIKQTVKDQVQGIIKPFISFIPAVLALLLFLTLQSLVSLINLLIYPLLWITFFALEKTGFIWFEVEQRPVKKMVV